MIGAINQWEIVNWMWALWLVFWIVTGLRVKRARRVEALGQRMGYLIPLLVACLLIFYQGIPAGLLDRRMFAADPRIGMVGIALAAAGTLIAVWARAHLGRNWSARITIRHDHELIQSGPYARLRHPIYSGLLVALAGTVVVLGEWRGLVGLVIAAIACAAKARREEAMLTQTFPEQYAHYRARSGMLLPRFRWQRTQ